MPSVFDCSFCWRSKANREKAHFIIFMPAYDPEYGPICLQCANYMRHHFKHKNPDKGYAKAAGLEAFVDGKDSGSS